MSVETIENKLKEIICDYADIQPEEICAETSLKNDIGIDSFGLISMICSIEDTFNVKIPDSILMGFKKISDISSYILANAC